MYSSAVLDLNSYAALSTNSSKAFFFRGLAYAGLYSYSNALQDLNMAVYLDSTNSQAYSARGVVFWAMNDIEMAVRDCARTVQLANDPVALHNVEGLWLNILPIGQNPDRPENQLALDRQPTPERKRIKALVIGARGGSVADYVQLCSLSDGTNAVATLAKAAVDDVVQYFGLYRDRMFLTRKFVDPARLQPMPVSIDEVVFRDLVSPHWTQRETAVFYLASRRSAISVPHLCEAIQRETNLYVISDITKALNEIAGTDHGPLSSEAVEKWWEMHKNEERYRSPFTAAQSYWGQRLLTPDEAKRAITVLGRTISSEPTAHWARCFRAGCFTVLHEFDLAEQELGQVERECPDLCWLLFYRTLLYEAEGRPERVEFLNRLLELYPGFEGEARRALGTNIVSDPRIKWPKKQIPESKS
jgi:tetratricopeptide (TPR) repeat protein